ncbi:type VII secretion protein EccB [Saccharopolyspora gregorii]|uniref:type VII secretion protein EccB n=1 Tax=Saccharopolyspora gregorii TaxID=33914 RepID=UPI0031E62F2E
MQSRRDQVQAYFFVVGRLISALMRGRPDEPSTPTRRFVMGAVIGTLLGCLVVAGFGVYGLIRPGGNTSWQQAGAIIVEKETGARYLYLQGKLRPVLNYSSALLAANNSTGGPQVKLVSQNSLQGVARATPIGIPGAPDSLPDAENLSRAPWVVCATTESSPAGTPTPITDLQVRSGTSPATRPATASARTASAAWSSASTPTRWCRSRACPRPPPTRCRRSSRTPSAATAGKAGPARRTRTSTSDSGPAPTSSGEPGPRLRELVPLELRPPAPRAPRRISLRSIGPAPDRPPRGAGR